MRRNANILPAAIAVMIVCLMFTGTARAGIVGSKHDFGQLNWSKTTDAGAGKEICLPCHTPHSAKVEDLNGVEFESPLWNHTLAANSYDMYIAGVKTAGQHVDTNSMLCLSCHDGTIALDSFGGGAGSAGKISGAANLGTDLSDDHPIGAAAVLVTPNPSYMGDPALRDAKRIMPLRKMPGTGKLAVGCTSCHEPHNRGGSVDASGNPTGPKHMLWVANEAPGTTVDGRAVSGSLLCMNCHKK